jgi:ubiquitin fusion degradation protein 1
MLFEIENVKQKKKTHCGVLEFVADEGVVYLPYWMMQNLLLAEGDVVKFQSAKLPKGSYVKLRPHTADFMNISNPKAVLETTLRSYTCLTSGDSILISYNNKRYFIDIVDAKPAPAISIVDTDCEVDFAPPLDYVEPAFEKPAEVRAAKAAAAAAAGGGGVGGGGGAKGADGGAEKGGEIAPAAAADDAPTFLAFAGGGRRLDGKSARDDLKPVEVELPTTSLKLSKEFEQFIRGPRPEKEGKEGGAKAKSEGGAASGLPRRKAGKLVFGGARGGGGGGDGAKAEEAKKVDEKSGGFKAFQGSGNKLK